MKLALVFDNISTVLSVPKQIWLATYLTGRIYLGGLTGYNNDETKDAITFWNELVV